MTGHAQSLADFARQERARRTNQTSAIKVFNNQTLQAPPQTALDSARTDELIGAMVDLQSSLKGLASSGIVESGREVVEGGKEMFREMIEGLEAIEVGIQQDMSLLRARLANPVMSAAGRTEAQEELADNERALSEVRVEVADLRGKLAELEGPGVN
jgi:hypothetical protein